MPEDERAGYRAAIDLWQTSSNQAWARFNAMLVGNAVIVAAIVQVLMKDSVPRWAILLPVAGLVLCVLWLLAVARGLAYQQYYVEAALRLEETLGPTVSVVRGGRTFEQREMRWSRLERMKTRGVMRGAIGLFGLLYLGSTPLLWAWRLPMIAFSVSKVVGSAGLLLALAGTVQIGWIRWGVTAGFTGSARLFGPEPTSQVSGTAAPADQRRWRRGWTLIFVGFALQLLGLWL